MPTPDETGTPGKTRTWWHPLLVALLEHELSPAFEIRDEVSVGTLPLRADIVLVRRGEAEIPDSARRSLRALAERLNRWTLIEFKSPMDSLERGDLGRLFGVGHLFVAQQSDAIAASDVSYIILASSLTKPLENEAQHLGLSLAEDEPGIWRIAGGLFTTWLIETDRLDDQALTVFSHVFLEDSRLIMDMVRDPETQPVLRYIFQQIRQFQQLGEAFMVQHTHTAEMDQEYAAFKEALVQSLTPDDLATLSADAAFKEALLQSLTPDDLATLSADAAFKDALLQSLTPEDLAGRLAELSPEEIRRVISPEDLVQTLTPEERRRLFERLCAEGFTPPGKQSPE
jgi:hypothetical protein